MNAIFMVEGERTKEFFRIFMKSMCCGQWPGLLKLLQPGELAASRIDIKLQDACKRGSTEGMHTLKIHFEF
jgi:hypothetical protein